ncbi:uncharacterized protein LOC131522494 [Onychostoma macrolepis]|uniref:DUF4806 domain-containing protein n=1 Tax=Onychostoma macrolepis TaxID=369639 RepID=A0A7J6C946_9TELE|nr:uncharacterized protein LOC131522494 [Onychostoma macrolepis]KAF4103571.1 hypothetical protein G5714_016454 [Onychostoma macrolepis]
MTSTTLDENLLMPFHLIEFQASEDIAVVPIDWYDDGMVYWLNFKSTERVKRAAANEEKHEPNWPRYDVKVIRTYDNYKDAVRLMNQYQTGCNTSELQSDAEQEGELPEKRVRKPVHRFGDSDESEEEPENGDFASLRSSRPFNLPGVSAEASSSSQLHWQTPPSRRVPGSRVTTPQPGENRLAPDHGAGQQHPSPPQLPAPAFNMCRVTQGTAGLPQLPPPPAPALNMRRTGEPCSSLTYRPTWRERRMTDTIPCSAAEVHILSLLETIKQQQDQLVARVNYLSSRLNSTPGPDVEMPDNIHFPLEQLEAVEAFEMFLKEPSNGPARQRVISSLATTGGQDVKRVTWNILGRLFTDEVSPQINWKGVNNKKPFSRMAAKTLLFSAVRKNTMTQSATDAEVTKHAIR